MSHPPLSELTALGPLDGRYRRATEALAPYFSESALQRYRLWVEVEYYLALVDLGLPQLPQFTAEHVRLARAAYREFDLAAAREIKRREQEVNHDVKAVEYYLKDWFREKLGLTPAQCEFVHFGLTSQDINNTAQPLALSEALHDVLLPELNAFIANLGRSAQQTRAQAMLARTHGQPASPTTLGKELRVFVERLQRQRDELEQRRLPAKFGGATGNFNAHVAAYLTHDWPAFATEFVEHRLGHGLVRTRTTTQIEPYDGLAACFDNLRRINVILVDLARDLWQYISLGYFRQQVVPGEVGSSAMPHKVNPIDFENAEGNLGIANALFDHFSNKLPVSRLQRDLSDSTVLRNLGVPLGHTFVALKALQRGLRKLAVNTERLRGDLDANWAVVAEGIQTILRREGYPEPYEALKALTRGAEIDQMAIATFIEGLDVSDVVKHQLRALSPHTYLGTATGEASDAHLHTAQE